jgi:putative hydrolases of HD superfamily
MEDLKSIIRFFYQLEGLKKTYRYKEAKDMPPESTADHSWKLAMMSYAVAEELDLSVDRYHAMSMAIIHDLPEIVTDDIDATLVNDGRVSAKKKQDMEIRAMEAITAILPADTGKKIYDLWWEFEECTTPEARFVRALDKLESLSHLIRSGWKTFDRPDFIPTHANKAVENFPELKPMLQILKKDLRIEYDKGNIPWRKEYD